MKLSYRMVLADKKQKGRIYQHLRHLHKPNKKRYRTDYRQGRMKNATNIDDKKPIGEGEGATIVKDNKHDLTL